MKRLQNLQFFGEVEIMEPTAAAPGWPTDWPTEVAPIAWSAEAPTEPVTQYRPRRNWALIALVAAAAAVALSVAGYLAAGQSARQPAGQTTPPATSTTAVAAPAPVTVTPPPAPTVTQTAEAAPPPVAAPAPNLDAQFLGMLRGMGWTVQDPYKATARGREVCSMLVGDGFSETQAGQVLVGRYGADASDVGVFVAAAHATYCPGAVTA